MSARNSTRRGADALSEVITGLYPALYHLGLSRQDARDLLADALQHPEIRQRVVGIARSIHENRVKRKKADPVYVNGPGVANEGVGA